MGRPKLTSDPKQLSVTVDALMLETLDLIGRASSVGRPTRAEMIRVALQEFIEARLASPEVKTFVDSQRANRPLRLHRTDAGENNGVAGD